MLKALLIYLDLRFFLYLDISTFCNTVVIHITYSSGIRTYF